MNPKPHPDLSPSVRWIVNATPTAIRCLRGPKPPDPGESSPRATCDAVGTLAPAARPGRTRSFPRPLPPSGPLLQAPCALPFLADRPHPMPPQDQFQPIGKRGPPIELVASPHDGEKSRETRRPLEQIPRCLPNHPGAPRRRRHAQRRSRQPPAANRRVRRHRDGPRVHLAVAGLLQVGGPPSVSRRAHRTGAQLDGDYRCEILRAVLPELPRRGQALDLRAC